MNRTALTLRLEPKMHSQLRLISDHAKISITEIIIMAIENYLEDDLTIETIKTSRHDYTIRVMSFTGKINVILENLTTKQNEIFLPDVSDLNEAIERLKKYVSLIK